MDAVAAQVAACPISAEGEAPIVVSCRGLYKSFGDVRAVDGLDLELPSGAIGALLGPSGCGKTTLLRLIAGFERPDEGSVAIGDATVSDGSRFVPPERRRTGMVFQDYALFPHLDVAGNVGYALGRRPDTARVREVLALVGLDGLGARRPHELSGGQQQRVALARALAPTPALILLDEPFSNLDAALRDRVRGEVRSILRAARVTALLVTHDQEEALSLADTVAVMRAGRIEQSGTPEEVYGSPANRWVGEFLGEIDVLPGEADAGVASCALGRVPAPRDLTGPVEVLIRPESIAVGMLSDDGEHEAIVVERTFYGHDQLVTLELRGGPRLRSRSVGFPSWHPGDRLRVRLAGPVTVVPAKPAHS
ncbi:MAG: ABC transporter ATP-binding protein [Solirubrobacteraceae bacterium]|nr:ABC transporter ATP-binding protein [Solirubrobacteraceae bacterium]